MYESLQCKITQKYVFYVIFFLRHVNNFFISFLFFLIFYLTFEVSQNLRDIKIIYGYKDKGWV
jgi:hypothetical protein